MRGKPRTSTTAELQKFPTLVHSRVGFPLFPAPSEPTFRVLFAHQTNTEASGGNRAGDSGSRPTARPSVGTLRPAARGAQLEHGVAGPPRPWSRGWFCISGIPAPAPMAACHRRPSLRSAGPSRGHPLLPAPLRKGAMELGLCGVFPTLCQPRNSEAVPQISLRALEQAGTCCHPAWGHQLSHCLSHWDGAGGFTHPAPKNRGSIRTKTPRRAPTGAQNLVIKQIKAEQAALAHPIALTPQTPGSELGAQLAVHNFAPMRDRAHVCLAQGGQKMIFLGNPP